jgi:hypothetical protein
MHADSLEATLDQLRSRDVGLTDDELSHLGVVLILRVVRQAPGVPAGTVRRIVAAHYLRPVARDGHGHIQRLPPAVLTTWDPQRDCFDHFAWALAQELGDRVGRRAGDFEREHGTRTEFLAGLLEGGVTAIGDVRSAIAGYRQMNGRAGDR